MCKKEFLPEVIVFAGPNGSGKSTITRLAKTIGKYINADDIKRTNLCSDLEAAQQAESLREQSVQDRADFTFETVLSTERNINLLKKQKKKASLSVVFMFLRLTPILMWPGCRAGKRKVDTVCRKIKCVPGIIWH